MKGQIKKYLCLAATVLVGYLSIYSRNGPTLTGDFTGSPLGNGMICNNCHTPAGNYTPVVTLQLLNNSNMAVTEYNQGVAYTVRVQINTATGSNPGYGFQMVALQTSTQVGINNWGIVPIAAKVTPHNGRDYVEHSFLLSNNVIDIPWTAPATNTGDITFYCAGNVVNGNYGPSGDNSAATQLTIHAAGLNNCTLPTLATTTSDVRCKGDSSGAISLRLNGGSAPYQYWWSGPSGFRSNSQNLNRVRAGTYSLVVTATGGCSTSKV